jgi:hypothetical protein
MLKGCEDKIRKFILDNYTFEENTYAQVKILYADFCTAENKIARGGKGSSSDVRALNDILKSYGFSTYVDHNKGSLLINYHKNGDRLKLTSTLLEKIEAQRIKDGNEFHSLINSNIIPQPETDKYLQLEERFESLERAFSKVLEENKQLKEKPFLNKLKQNTGPIIPEQLKKRPDRTPIQVVNNYNQGVNSHNQGA